MVHHSEIHQKTTGDPSCVHMFCITSSQIHTYSVTSRYRTLRSGLLAILLGARTLLVTRASLRTERSDAPIGAPNGLPGDPKRPSLHTSEARAHTRVPPGCVCVCVPRGGGASRATSAFRREGHPCGTSPASSESRGCAMSGPRAKVLTGRQGLSSMSSELVVCGRTTIYLDHDSQMWRSSIWLQTRHPYLHAPETSPFSHSKIQGTHLRVDGTDPKRWFI